MVFQKSFVLESDFGFRHDSTINHTLSEISIIPVDIVLQCFHFVYCDDSPRASKNEKQFFKLILVQNITTRIKHVSRELTTWRSIWIGYDRVRMLIRIQTNDYPDKTLLHTSEIMRYTIFKYSEHKWISLSLYISRWKHSDKGKYVLSKVNLFFKYTKCLIFKKNYLNGW